MVKVLVVLVLLSLYLEIKKWKTSQHKSMTTAETDQTGFKSSENHPVTIVPGANWHQSMIMDLNSDGLGKQSRLDQQHKLLRNQEMSQLA